jgi:hypothetical protein
MNPIGKKRECTVFPLISSFGKKRECTVRLDNRSCNVLKKSSKSKLLKVCYGLMRPIAQPDNHHISEPQCDVFLPLLSSNFKKLRCMLYDVTCPLWLHRKECRPHKMKKNHAQLRISVCHRHSHKSQLIPWQGHIYGRHISAHIQTRKRNYLVQNLYCT